MLKEVSKILNLKNISILIITLSLIYLAILILNGTYKNCEDWQCFNKQMSECKPTKFIGTSKNMIFQYTIQGKKQDKCIIKVKLLQGELNNIQSKKIEGKEMICSIPIGAIQAPESDISLCHGLLKESLQDLIIQKLNNYIAKNLGKINLQMLNKYKNSS